LLVVEVAELITLAETLAVAVLAVAETVQVLTPVQFLVYRIPAVAVAALATSTITVKDRLAALVLLSSVTLLLPNGRIVLCLRFLT
jgi:hypothetical protein